MGQITGKLSPKKVVEQAKSLRPDLSIFQNIREAIKNAGNAVTFKSAKGKVSSEISVYAGDISAEDSVSVSQMRPLFHFDTKILDHCATVKDGVTNEVLMMMVRELNDDPWIADESFKMTMGGRTEARIYANGRPVGVSFKNYVDVAPSSQVDGEERPQVGASMVELLKIKDAAGIVFARRRKDSTPGSHVAAFSRIRGGGGVCRILQEDVVDPIVICVMAWFISISDK